jgi:hypothetical protein
MGVPTLEVGYTSATTGRGHHEVHKGHVVALGKKNFHGFWKKSLYLSKRRWLFTYNDTPLPPQEIDKN